MQFQNEELKYQQAILKHLGYYRGSVDGIWSDASIEAKKKFEFKREFSPAIPNNGLPFGLSDRLPKGLFFKRVGTTMVLQATGLSDTDLASLLGKAESTVASRAPQVSNDGPVVETPTDNEAVVSETVEVEVPVEVARPAPTPQQNPQHNPQHQHQKQRPQHPTPNNGQRR